MNQSALDKIRNYVNSDRIVVFMKGTKDFPQCGFSATVAEILKRSGVPFASVNVLADHDVREGIKEYSNWPTIPQVYLNGNFVGGCDIMRQLYESQELPAMLKDALEGERKLV